jgi:ArsR family transcriptional regulator
MTVYEERAKLYKAFCDEKRQRILELLQDGEQCGCVLTEKMGLPQSTLSYHMQILCDSGIVVGREEGKWTHYSIDRHVCVHAASMIQEITGQKAEQPDNCPCGN